MATIPLGGGPDGIAAGGDAVWATNGLAGTLQRVSPETNEIVQTVTRAGRPAGGRLRGRRRLGGEPLRPHGDAHRRRQRPVAWTARVGGSPIGIAVGAGAVWATNETDASVSRIDPRTGRVLQRIGVGNSPGPVEAGAGRRVGREHARRHGLAHRSGDQRGLGHDPRRRRPREHRGR